MLARVEGQQFAAAQAILCLYEQDGGQLGQKLARAKSEFDRATEQIETQSREVAELAHGASEEHEGYDAFVESLSRVTADKIEFAEHLHTIQRLSAEGRATEAKRFAADVEAQGERWQSEMLSLLGRFQAGSLRRVAEHQVAQWRAAWAGLFLAIAACAAMTIFFRLRLRQARREFAQYAKDVVPRAEYLKIARAYAEVTSDPEPVDDDHQTLAGCRVLAAEDGPHNQRFIKRVLSKAGADVTIAENGNDAVELTFAASKEGNPFDVVLMDMQMPVMDGMEAMQTLRRFHYQGTIVAVSANSQGQNRERCLDAGCDDYLAKPISRDELLAIVGRFYVPPAKEASAPAVAG